jgi:hypothetical protein
MCAGVMRVHQIVVKAHRPLMIDGQLCAAFLFGLQPRMYEVDHVVLGAACCGLRDLAQYARGARRRRR